MPVRCPNRLAVSRGRRNRKEQGAPGLWPVFSDLAGAALFLAGGLALFRRFLFRFVFFFPFAKQNASEEIQREELEQDHRYGVAISRPDIDDMYGGDTECGHGHDDDFGFFA